MGFSEMLWGAEKLVPAESWCPYGNNFLGENFEWPHEAGDCWQVAAKTGLYLIGQS